MSMDVHLSVAPSNGKPQRIVVATVGNLEHRDNINTDSSLSRRRFLRELAEKLTCDPASLSYLDEQLTAAADAADAQAQADTENVGETKKGPPQAKRLLEVAQGAQELWHTPDSETYATIEKNGHLEHHRIRSRHFRLWLDWQYFLKTGSAPNSEARQSALALIEAMARFEGQPHDVHLRTAEFSGHIFIDLCDSDWQVVEITPHGWRILAGSPVRFRRAKAMLPLPVPVVGGLVDEFRRFINIEDCEWPLLLAWLVAALRPRGPYPVLNLHGEAGAGKSTVARMLRGVIDPNTAPIRSEPREPRDLMIAANNGWIIALDNLSYVPTWLSDAICRLATGGGFSTRTLYENDEETIFDAMRPGILTGIEELAVRGDLIDRSLLFNLPVIPDDRRRPEAELMIEYEQARPRIFGALLSAVSVALRNLASTRLDRSPRMADFAVWATAAEPGLGLEPGEFLDSYDVNRDSANDLVLEASPVAKLLIELAHGDGWNGTAAELLAVLESRADEKTKKQRAWPTSPRSLAGTVKRLAPNLRSVGVEVKQIRIGHSRRRTILIRWTEKVGNPSSASSAPSAEHKNTGATADANAGHRPQQRPHDPAEDLGNSWSAAGADDADAKKQPYSGPTNRERFEI